MEGGLHTGNRLLYLDTVETLVTLSGFQVTHMEVRGRLCVEPTEKLARSFHHSPAQVHQPHVKKTGTLPHSGSFLCVKKFVRHFRKEGQGDREGSAI